MEVLIQRPKIFARCTKSHSANRQNAANRHFSNPPKPILDHIFRNSSYGFEAWFVESEKSRYARTKSMVLVWNSFSREQLGNCGQNSRKSVTLNYVKAVSKIDFLKNVDSQRSARRIFKFQTTKRLRTLNRTLHLRRPNVTMSLELQCHSNLFAGWTSNQTR